MGSGSVVREQKTASFFPLLFPLVFLPTLARLSRECPCISEGTKKRRLFVHRTDDKCARAFCVEVERASSQANKKDRVGGARRSVFSGHQGQGLIRLSNVGQPAQQQQQQQLYIRARKQLQRVPIPHRSCTSVSRHARNIVPQPPAPRSG